MSPIESAWSVVPWRRDSDDAAPPLPDAVVRELTERIEDRPDDARVMITAGTLRDLLPRSTPDSGWLGAEIHDDDRSVTYRATVDPKTSDLNHLEVIVRGWIDDNSMRRVPVARIRREVLRQVAADARERIIEGHPDVFTVVLPGGQIERPSLEEVAQLIRKGRDRAWFHATFPTVPQRTVDGWMRRARKKFPMTPGKPSAGSTRGNKRE